MAKRGLQPQGVARRNKILRSAVKLFLEKGYAATTTSQIMQATGMATSSFFAAFRDKEALLLTLVERMFDSQFENAARAVGPGQDPLLFYAVETALQMYITELSEPLRELYVTAYTLPSTSAYINECMVEKLRQVFGSFRPEAEPRDFYELELASSGVTRSFMARHCDIYFTMERKLRRYLGCCFRLFDVPADRYAPVIETILQMPLAQQAGQIIESTVAQAEAGFEALLHEEDTPKKEA